MSDEEIFAESLLDELDEELREALKLADDRNMKAKALLDEMTEQVEEPADSDAPAGESSTPEEESPPASSPEPPS